MAAMGSEPAARAASTTTVQDHANLLVSSDFAGGQAGGIRKNFQIAGEVGFPERNIHEIAAFGCIEFSHGLSNTASQKLVLLGALLNDVGRKNFGNDHIGAKSRHGEISKNGFTVRA
jgi:hypothetical protein